MSFVYPTNDLDRRSTLLSLLGSFWSTLYEDRGTVAELLRGRAICEQQTLQKMSEFLAARGRRSTPVWHQDKWISLTLKLSEKTTNGTRSEWPAPTDLADASAIVNRLSSPSLTLTRNVDFEVTNSLISFKADPFDDDAVPTLEVEDDEEAYLWIFNGSVDTSLLYRFWGYVIGISLPSSEAYKSLMNAYLDAVTGGTAIKQICNLYSALAGIPLAKHTGEVVEQICEDLDGILVVTTEDVYRLPSTANVIVAAGDELTECDPLCDSLRIVELHDGEVPSYLTQLSLDRTMIPLAIDDELVFINEEVPLTTSSSFSSSNSVSSSIGESTESVAIRFYIGGSAQDVEVFWAAVRAAEAREGYSLADLLRVHPEGQTTPANLPATINPLEFLIENLLRFNTVLAVVRPTALGGDALGLDKVSLIRPVVPIGKSVLTVEVA